MMNGNLKFLPKKDLRRSVALVVGTRPGIIMFSPIARVCADHNLDFFIIHTGQHYSPNMDRIIFEDLGLPKPRHQIMGVSDKKLHGAQTSAMLEGVEKVLVEEWPSIVLVGGDANTNLAGALAARKLHMTLGHVEAGERSFDWRMPEEHNRRIIDHIADYLFTTGERGKQQLLDEAVQGKIIVTGNTIVDASQQNLELAKQKSDVLNRFNLTSNAYALLTTHREENVDSPELLQGELEGVSRASVMLDLPMIFLAHPRTLKRLREFDMLEYVRALPGIRTYESVGYLDFLNLLAHSRLVFTDSGGVQQEACIHRVPTVTLRENTEWVETLEHGANRLAGTDPDRILSAAVEAHQVARKWPIPFGDGNAARRIVDICIHILEG